MCGTSVINNKGLSGYVLNAQANAKLTTDTTVDTLDVVFHLMHTGEPLGQGANISDAQVESALLSLNRDFGAWPIHDSIAVRPNGVDSKFYFRLACTDPSGQTTTGINRINASSISD